MAALGVAVFTAICGTAGFAAALTAACGAPVVTAARGTTTAAGGAIVVTATGKDASTASKSGSPPTSLQAASSCFLTSASQSGPSSTGGATGTATAVAAAGCCGATTFVLTEVTALLVFKWSVAKTFGGMSPLPRRFDADDVGLIAWMREIDAFPVALLPPAVALPRALPDVCRSWLPAYS